MSEVKDTIVKLKHSKIDIAAMVNNAVLLVLAWLVAYWFFQFFILVPAFTTGVKMIIYNSYIDFNSVNSASSDEDIWASADNIYNIFGTPVIFSTILIICATLLLIKWNPDRLNIRRFLFWLILCITIRVNGNYIFGHLYNVWSCNLVTDFLGITYPSRILRALAIIVVFFITIVIFRAMTNEIKKLFNPYMDGRVNNLFSNIFLPSVIASIIILILDLPSLPKNELSQILFFLFMLFIFMCRPFLRTYRGVAQPSDAVDDEHINIIPIIILGVVAIANYYFAPGRLLTPSAYRFYFVENIIFISIVIGIIIILLIAIRVYNRRKKMYKKTWNEKMKEIDAINESVRIKTKYKMPQSKDTSNEEEHIDLAHNKEYGFKSYDLKKYNDKE